MHSMLGIAPARGRCYKKHSMHFAPQNREENHAQHAGHCSCKRQML